MSNNDCFASDGLIGISKTEFFPMKNSKKNTKKFKSKKKKMNKN